MTDPRPHERLQVGAPDPELETSPIVGGDDEERAVEPGGRVGACYFNGVAFAAGDFVVSGSELLRCELPGVWVREGEIAP